MARRFLKLIPKLPLYKQNTYIIPNSYSELYEENGVINANKKKALFYVTQFGGFKLSKIPSYFADEQEFFSEWFKSKTENGFTYYKANTAFISRLGGVKIQPLIKSHFREVNYSDVFLAENGFTREEADQIRAFQDKLNQFYEKFRLNIFLPHSGLTAEDRIDLSRLNAIAHLQFKPKAGGRLFQSGPGGSYQRISSGLRPFLTINGESTTELDITAATMQFLNASLEKTLGYCALSKQALMEDPYEFFVEKINADSFKNVRLKDEYTGRDDVKNILYTIIYSKLNCQERNVNRRLRLMGKGYYYSDLKKNFPEFFESMTRLKTAPYEDGKVYPPHIAIYKEESRFAREVLQRSCLDENFVVLPIHDSFITTKDNKERLEKIVGDVSYSMYGYVMPYKYKV